MKRKVIIGVVGLFLIILIVIGILFSTHVICIKHEWESATCTEAQKCVYCGKTRGEPLGHKWKVATCTEPKKCSRCQLEEGEPLGHQWQEATCTEPQKCSRCQLEEGEPLGHMESDWEITKDATMDEDGEMVKKCVVCGEIIDTKPIPKEDNNPYSLGKFVERYNAMMQKLDQEGQMAWGMSENDVVAGKAKLLSGGTLSLNNQNSGAGYETDIANFSFYMEYTDDDDLKWALTDIYAICAGIDPNSTYESVTEVISQLFDVGMCEKNGIEYTNFSMQGLVGIVATRTN